MKNVSIFAVEGTPEQVRAIRRAVRRCRFDFDRLLPRMEKKGFESVRVVFDGNAPVLQGGRFWAFAQTFSRCTMTVRPDISPLATQVVFLHEVGHFVDAFVLNDAKRRQIHRLYHGNAEPNHGWFEPDPQASGDAYRREQQEGFASDFITLFSDVRPGPFQVPYTHDLPRSLYSEIRQIVKREREEAEPEPEPISDPEPTPPPSEPDPDKAKLTKALRAAMERIEAAKAALDPEDEDEDEGS